MLGKMLDGGRRDAVATPEGTSQKEKEKKKIVEFVTAAKKLSLKYGRHRTIYLD